MRAAPAPERWPDPVTTILIAHGDPDVRALYRAMLASSSCVIEECDDGAEALGKAIAATPDAIIVSARLPRIDGLSLCRLLRADTKTRGMGIIMLTADDNPVETARARNAGADLTLSAQSPLEAITDALRTVSDPSRERNAPLDNASVAGGSAAPAPRRPRARMLRREQTTTPPLLPPALHCPACQGPLTYQHSQTGGVNDSAFEQWDYFRCHSCGPYQYRHRTRKLRAT